MNLADQLARIEQAPKGPNVGAFFDLDGTLVAGYTATAFFREQVAGRHVDPGTALRSLVAAVDGTFLGGSPIKGSQLAFAALAGKDESLLADLGERLFRTQIAGTIRAEARELVRAHQRAGHTVVVSSAATRYQIGPVARDLGISELVCTELEVNEGLLTGAIRGRMRWGREKASGVRAYAREHGVDRIPRGTGDIADDHPLFAGECIDERGLANVRSPHDGDANLFALILQLLYFRKILDHQVQDPFTSSLHTPSLRGFAGFFYFVVAKVLYGAYWPCGKHLGGSSPRPYGRLAVT